MNYDIPVPGPHWIRKNSKEKWKKPSGEQQRRIPLQDG